MAELHGRCNDERERYSLLQGDRYCRKRGAQEIWSYKHRQSRSRTHPFGKNPGWTDQWGCDGYNPIQRWSSACIAWILSGWSELDRIFRFGNHHAESNRLFPGIRCRRQWKPGGIQSYQYRQNTAGSSGNFCFNLNRNEPAYYADCSICWRFYP